MPPQNSSPAPKRRKTDVDSDSPAAWCRSITPDIIFPEVSQNWGVTAGWHEEPDGAVEGEWMAYIWGVYRRSSTLLAGLPQPPIVPSPWTLKQLSNPKAAKIFEDVEGQIQRQRCCSPNYQDEAPQFSRADWANSRWERLWPLIFKKALRDARNVRYIGQYVEELDWWDSEIKAGWKFEPFNIDGIKTMLFKDGEFMVLQDWVAPIDMCHQLQEMHSEICCHRENLIEGVIVAQSEVPKSSRLQAELDKYFGLLTLQDGDGTYSAAMQYVRAAEEKVWQTPEFAGLVEMFRKFAASCHARIMKKKGKKGREHRIQELTSEVNRLSSLLLARNEELEKLQNEQPADLENPEQFDEFDTFWSRWESEVQKAKEHRASKVKYPEPRLG